MESIMKDRKNNCMTIREDEKQGKRGRLETKSLKRVLRREPKSEYTLKGG